ncbi:hypothetical protein BC629DRAFT_1497664 [Irpex lacteus]|nr:hypothetical protein BC629DRAFT_1497664 [Irpex lacteus]
MDLTYRSSSYTFQIIFGTFLSLTLAWFFALRTYALWCCRRTVFIVVALAYVPGFSLNLVTMLLKDIPTPLGIKVSGLVPICFVFFDILVLLLSLAALRRTHGSLSTNKLGSFSALFMNHGILYFVLLTFLNIPQVIVTHAVNQPFNAGVMYSLSSLLVSRFMLRLGEASSLPHYYPPPAKFLKRWSYPTRDMIVGNMAEPLEPFHTEVAY